MVGNGESGEAGGFLVFDCQPLCAGCGEPICDRAWIVLDAEHGGGNWHSACLHRRLVDLGPERHADPAVAVPAEAT